MGLGLNKSDGDCDIEQMIAPYSSLSKKFKRAASSSYTSSLFSEKTRKIIHFLSWLGKV
jgi:hypothetical protein